MYEEGHRQLASRQLATRQLATDNSQHRQLASRQLASRQLASRQLASNLIGQFHYTCFPFKRGGVKALILNYIPNNYSKYNRNTCRYD